MAWWCYQRGYYYWWIKIIFCFKNFFPKAEDALTFLTERRDFWAQSNPEYPEMIDADLKAGNTQWKNALKKSVVVKETK